MLTWQELLLCLNYVRESSSPQVWLRTELHMSHLRRTWYSLNFTTQDVGHQYRLNSTRHWRVRLSDTVRSFQEHRRACVPAGVEDDLLVAEAPLQDYPRDLELSLSAVEIFACPF